MIKQATDQEIAAAAEVLRQGGLVAFPTETVFGLGADATSDTAVEKVFAVKRRDRSSALAVMVQGIEHAKELAQLDARALTLMHALWPGPVSIVLPCKPDHPISAVALAGQETISLRMPKHPVALRLLQEFGGFIAAPSANPSGSLSTTTALDVARDLGDAVPVVLADATPLIGLESTIVDLTGAQAKILRHGAITQGEIEALIGPVQGPDKSDKPLKLNTALRLDAVDVKAGEAFLGFGNLQFIGVEGVGFVRDMPSDLWRNLSPEGDLHQAATNLYTMLQELDRIGATRIAVMRLPETGLGVTINDRLRRAAGGTTNG